MPYTLRELEWMIDGQSQRDWVLTSSIMALIANCHRGHKTQAYTPSQFNPMDNSTVSNVKSLDSPINLREMKRLFTGK